mmetsp:Transcript_37528/g.69399  ORF Transcript_37528/g.69399 Transcript_37528/m.69399 type:complete len:244 (+) Transcript_37528:1128-1859(+)
MHEAQEIEVESVPRSFHAEDVLPHGSVLAQGGFQENQPLPLRPVRPLLPELDHRVPRSVREFAVALGALFELDDQLHHHALLHGHPSPGPESASFHLGTDHEPNLKPHAVRLGPHPHGVDDVYPPHADGFGMLLSSLAVLEGRNVLQAQREQFRRFRLVVFVPTRRGRLGRSLVTAASTALVDGDVVGSTRSSLQDSLEIELLRKACPTLIGRVRVDHRPTQAAGYLDGGPRGRGHDGGNGGH